MTEAVARLGLQIDASQVVSADAALENFRKTARATANDNAAFAASGNQATQAMAGVEQRLSLGQRAMGAFRQAASGVGAQLVALSAGAGPVGVFLASLGPWGLAAAIGIGAASNAISFMAQESERMGRGAQELRGLSAAIDLTVAQISALKKGAAEFGVGGDAIATGLERLTGGLQDARRGTGPLFEDIQKVNGELANQLQQTHTVAEGIDVLARAWRNAGDAQAKLDLSRSIFGRGGGNLGPVLGKIAESGGLDQFTAGLKDVSVQLDPVITRWAQLQAKIDDTNKRAANILAAIFTDQGLAAQLRAAEVQERFAKASREIAADKGSGVLSFLGAAAQASDPQSSIEAGRRERDSAERRTALKAEAEEFTKLDVAMGNVVLQTNRAREADEKYKNSLKAVQDAAAGAKNQQAEFVQFLGSGATVTDRLVSRQKEIASLYADNKTGTATQAEKDLARARADSAAKLDSVIERETLRIGVLGNLATIQDKVTAVQLQIAKANQQGAGIDTRTAQRIKDYTAATELGTLAIREQSDAQKIEAATIGQTADKVAAYKAEQERLADFRRRGITLTDEQSAALRREALALGEATLATNNKRLADQNAFDRAQLGRTPSEQKAFSDLRSAGIDPASEMGRLRMQEILATENLREFGSSAKEAFTGFASDIRHGTNALEAMNRQVDRLIDKVTGALADKAIAAALGTGKSGGGGLLSLFGGTGGGPKVIGDTMVEPGVYGPNAVMTSHGGGTKGESSGWRHVDPRVFTQKAHSGIGPGERGIVIRDDEGVFTPGQMRALGMMSNNGGGSQIVVNDWSGHAQARKNPTGPGIEVLIPPLDAMMAAHINGGRSQSARAMQSRNTGRSLRGS